MIEAFIELKEIHTAFEATEQVLEEDIGRSICLPNCGLCCEQNVPVWTIIEAINAVSVLTGKAQLKKFASLAEGWLREKHHFATLYEGAPAGLASPRLREQWQATIHSQCPFLETDKRCSIYDVRPLTCRAWGVTRDCSDTCPRPLGRNETETTRRYIPADLIREAIEAWRARCKAKNPVWIISGFIPAVFYRAAEPEKFKAMVKDNQIASAKLVGTEYETTLMWQPQVNAVRQGLMPDLALMARGKP